MKISLVIFFLNFRYAAKCIDELKKNLLKPHSCFNKWVRQEQPGTTIKRVDKVKPLFDLLIPHFQQSYKPSKHVAVDKTVVGFRECFGPKHYLPKSQ